MKWKKATAVLLSMVMAVTAAACGSTRQTQGGSSETEIAAAFAAAKRTPKAPTVIEFIIEREANVLPIVPPGSALDHMILESGDN